MQAAAFKGIENGIRGIFCSSVYIHINITIKWLLSVCSIQQIHFKMTLWFLDKIYSAILVSRLT